jgi:hypothetical protein
MVPDARIDRASAIFRIGGVAELGGIVIAGSSAAFGKLIVDETEKCARVIRAARRRKVGHIRYSVLPGRMHRGWSVNPAR